MTEKTCPLCGAAVKEKNRTYCSPECSQNASRKRQAKGYEKNKKKTETYAPLLSPGKNRARTGRADSKGASLMEGYAKARAEGTHGGLTYGYWVAKHYAERGEAQGV